MAFGKNLQKFMDVNDLTIPDVVEKTGVPYTTLHSIISRDSANVAVTVAIRISKGLGVPLDELNDWTGSHPLPHNETEAAAMLDKERGALLADINLLSPEDREQVKGLIQHLAKRGREQGGRKR